MPKVRWGIGAEDVDDFDRSSQYTPYAGPTPPNGVYMWLLKKLQHVSGTQEKNPQLRVGLELIPRAGREESAYRGYWMMDFIPISGKTGFRYVPLLDVLGVSGRDFAEKTITDADGNIQRIGAWRNTGDVILLAQIKDGTDAKGNAAKDIGTYLAPTDDDEEEFEDDEDNELDAYDDEEYGDEEYDEED